MPYNACDGGGGGGGGNSRESACEVITSD